MLTTEDFAASLAAAAHSGAADEASLFIPSSRLKLCIEGDPGDQCYGAHCLLHGEEGVTSVTVSQLCACEGSVPEETLEVCRRLPPLRLPGSPCRDGI